MNHYYKLTEYFHHLIDHHHLHFCIKDFCGFIPINKELDEALQPFLAHTNPFCMYIKHDKKKYQTCLSLIKKMYTNSDLRRQCFYGVCHAGLGEYVVPIILDDIVMGTINIGFFQTDETRFRFLLHRCCNTSELLDEEKALRLFQQNIHTPLTDIKEILVGVELVAEYLSNTYQAMQSTHQLPERMRYHSSEDTIITHAIEFIRRFYNTHISIAKMAHFCHCSESYLSRVFKKRTGVNINVYINKVRVELAKNYLLLTSDNISEIALNLGFNDPNYFSRVFTSLIGHSPSEFRRRFQDDICITDNAPEEIINNMLKQGLQV